MYKNEKKVMKWKEYMVVKILLSAGKHCNHIMKLIDFYTRKKKKKVSAINTLQLPIHIEWTSFLY